MKFSIFLLFLCLAFIFTLKPVYAKVPTVGFWAEDSIYNYFDTTKNTESKNNFEQWANNQIVAWNNMLADAGIRFRFNLDHVVRVADGALPLGRKEDFPTNNPDSRDKGINLQWGFPKSWLELELKRKQEERKNIIPNGTDWGLLHELTHKLSLPEEYLLNIEVPRDQIEVTDPSGKPIVGNYIQPVNQYKIYETKLQGLMNNHQDQHFYSAYSAHILNGILNAIDIGDVNLVQSYHEKQYLNDIPKDNILRILGQEGKPMEGASIKIYQSVYPPGGEYGAKRIDNVADITGVTDKDGEVSIGNTPFGFDNMNFLFRIGDIRKISHNFNNGVFVLEISKDNLLEYKIIEFTDFSLAYWFGSIEKAFYEINTNFTKSPDSNTYIMLTPTPAPTLPSAPTPTSELTPIPTTQASTSPPSTCNPSGREPNNPSRCADPTCIPNDSPIIGLIPPPLCIPNPNVNKVSQTPTLTPTQEQVTPVESTSTSVPTPPLPIGPNVFILEDDGTLESAASNGKPMILTKKFYENYPDQYDFIGFHFKKQANGAYGYAAQRPIKGAFTFEHPNQTVDYGSKGRLLGGYVDAFSFEYQYVKRDPNTAALFFLDSFYFKLLLHELTHYWGVYLPDELKEALVGGYGVKDEPLAETYEQSHWESAAGSWISRLPSSRNRVIESPDGKYYLRGDCTSESIKHHDFDLYSMGLKSPEEIKEKLIAMKDPRAIGLGALCETIEVRASNVEKVFTIQDMVKVLGPRMPSVENSQKDFNIAFVLIVPKGTKASQEEIDALNWIADKFPIVWHKSTEGRSTLNGIKPKDTTPPTISNVKISTVKSSITVSWSTNEPTSPIVIYRPNNVGISIPYPNFITNPPKFSTSHTITIEPINTIMLVELNPKHPIMILSIDQDYNMASFDTGILKTIETPTLELTPTLTPVETKRITEITINGIGVNINNPFVDLRLPGTEGEANKFVIEVVITYSDGSSKSINLVFDYFPLQPPTSIPTPTSISTPTPNPTVKPTGQYCNDSLNGCPSGQRCNITNCDALGTFCEGICISISVPTPTPPTLTPTPSSIQSSCIWTTFGACGSFDCKSSEKPQGKYCDGKTEYRCLVDSSCPMPTPTPIPGSCKSYKDNLIKCVDDKRCKWTGSLCVDK